MSTSVPDVPLELGQTPDGYRSGFVSIVGRPNVGKSTLMNRMCGSKVAITSSRPQTTRNAIRGIHTTQSAQFVFVDTPGLHKPRTALGKTLNRAARTTLAEVDAVLFVVDVADGVGSGDEFIANELKDVRGPIVVALNKTDDATGTDVALARVKVERFGRWQAFATSALTGDGVEELVAALTAELPPGPLYYPPDAITDQPEKQVIAELIREKLLEVTHEELPHSIAVVVDEVETDEDGTIQIDAAVYVERSSQKGIVIGKGGAVLKDVGTRARADIERLLGTHVFLNLRVKVEPNWQRRQGKVERFGYGT